MGNEKNKDGYEDMLRKRAEKKELEEKAEKAIDKKVVCLPKTEIPAEENVPEKPPEVVDKIETPQKKDTTEYRIINSFVIQREVGDAVLNFRISPGEQVPEDLPKKRKEELFNQGKLAKVDSDGVLVYSRTAKSLERGEVIYLAENPVNITPYLQQFNIDADSLHSLKFELKRKNTNPLYAGLIDRELENDKDEKEIQ